MKRQWIELFLGSIMVMLCLWFTSRIFYSGSYWDSIFRVASVPIGLGLGILLIFYFLIGWSNFIVLLLSLASWILITVLFPIPILLKALTGRNMYVLVWDAGSWWEDNVPMSVVVMVSGCFPALGLVFIEVNLVQLWL